MTMPSILEAKIQKISLTRKCLVTRRRGPDKGEKVEKERRYWVKVGSYIQFDDGFRIQGPDGRKHSGKGTVVRFSNRHRTWSVQQPQRCQTNRMGYEFTRDGEPCWLEPVRQTGFSPGDFRRLFSRSFVELCEAAHAIAERQAE